APADNIVILFTSHYGLQLMVSTKCVAFECQHLNTSFIPLSGEWISKTDGKFKKNVTYTISLCGPINSKAETGNSCVSGTAICMTYDNGTSLSAGSFASERDEIPGVHNEEIGESWLAFAGDICPENTDYNMTTLINIKCGLTKGAGTASATHLELGSPVSDLAQDKNGRLVLVYKSEETPAGCTSPPTTTIEFICPDKGQSKDPMVTEDFDCQYVVEWQTEYACEERTLTNSSCLLSSPRYDLDFDLRPLTLPPETGIQCPDEEHKRNIPACQISQKNSDYGKSMGSTDHMSISYVDNDLVLTYKGGDGCEHNRMQRQTVINFKCNMSAENNGAGNPKFNREGDCIYFFDWDTKYACIDHPVGEECGSNWLALHDGDTEATSKDFYINVCHTVLRSGEASRCDPGAAICLREHLSTKNLGRYEKAPFYNEKINMTQIVYSNGDMSANMSLSGILLSPVNLVISREITAGFREMADSPTDSAHDYLVNVCGPLQGTGCDGLQEGQAGVCQVPTTGDGESFNAGQFTQQLTYYDGMINLTYTGGTPYHDTDKTPRQSEINFLCDRNAGMGNPKFLVEAASNHSYLFEWRTAFACPGTPMDLARSSDEENWSVAGPTSGSKFYLNVCGPLNSVGKGTGCSALASVCSTTLQDGKEQVDNADLGRVSTGLAIEVEGRLKLRYESPGLCHNGSASVPYDGPCEFTFTWLTSAACPLTRDKEVSNRSCSVKDPNSDYVFNLQPLNKTGPYEVKSGDMSFLTVPAGVCELATIKQALAEPSTDLDFSKTGKMVLKFDGKRNSNGERVNVEVEFECDSSLDLGTPEFVALEGITYRFQFRTSLVCAPRGTDCVVQDDAGHQYDLTQLARDTWWKAVDSRGSQTYYINVCRPVNNAPGTSCPDGPIGGCQSAANNRSFNIGYIHSKPVANDGTLSLHYRNGDLCHVGTPNQAHRSTTINFVCGSTEQGPVFMEETETCEYVFNWVTPAACPLQRIVGKDCHVTDPRYGYQFDLTPLRKAGTDYRVKDGEYEYVLNACGALVDSTTCGEGAGACQTKPNSDFTSITAGKANSSIMYSNGELTVTYLGGKANCHGQYERQTIIKFTCDASKDGTDGPIFIEESYNCKYVFEWPTHRACPPWKAGACALSNGGNNYDLFDLTMTNDNYEARDGDIKYIINVCRSVIHQKNALCPYDSAVCMVDTTKLDNDTNKYQDLGEPNSDQISFEAGHLVLTYTGGITCDSSGGKMKTVILFQCDPQAKDTSPGDHFMVGECEHHFTWTTSAACPMGEVNNPTILTSNITCQVKNPRSGVCQSETSDSQRAYNGGDAVHDLFYDNGNVVQELSGGDPCHNNQFKRSTYITFVCNDHHGIGRPVFQGETDDCTYYISWSTNLVCENDVKCTVDTGSGTLDLSSLSRVTDKVVTSTYDGSTFYLSSSPVFVSKDDCVFTFSWSVPNVCVAPASAAPPTVNMCGFNDKSLGQTYDFKQLGSKTYEVNDPSSNEIYVVRMCGNITSGGYQASCNGAMVCRKRDGLSFGAARNFHSTKEENAIKFTYAEGEKCSGDRKAESHIRFECDRTVKDGGKPEFLDGIGCDIELVWKTDVVCPIQFSPCRTISDGHVYDLSLLSKTDYNKDRCIFEFTWNTSLACKVQRQNVTVVNGMVKDPRSGIAVNLAPIWDQHTSHCSNGAVVCLNRAKNNKVLGMKSHAAFFMEDERVEARYSTDTRCSGDLAQENVTSVIQFVCSSNNIGPRLIHNSSECLYVFNWETTAACLTASITLPIPANPSAGGQSTDGKGGLNPGATGAPSSKKGGLSGKTVGSVVATFFALIVFCVLLVVFHRKERRETCFNNMRGLFSRTNRREYSQLPTDGIDDIFGEGDEVITVEDAAGGLRNDTAPTENDHIVSVETRSKTYHDDSDEELLA
ncbi:MPRI-like protein, partial [Mya arenaria]